MHPQAVVSLGWNMATTISSRRIAHYRRGIPSRVQLPVQSALASGATVCLAVLAWHYAAYMDRMWESHLEGAMVALIAIITYVLPLCIMPLFFCCSVGIAANAWW
jgi:Kef-type K+ transport system membrane component KefB